VAGSTSGGCDYCVSSIHFLRQKHARHYIFFKTETRTHYKHLFFNDLSTIFNDLFYNYIF
jgi:hypothetical protein